jgi:hypothetical protein
MWLFFFFFFFCSLCSVFAFIDFFFFFFFFFSFLFFLFFFVTPPATLTTTYWIACAAGARFPFCAASGRTHSATRPTCSGSQGSPACRQWAASRWSRASADARSWPSTQRRGNGSTRRTQRRPSLPCVPATQSRAFARSRTATRQFSGGARSIPSGMLEKDCRGKKKKKKKKKKNSPTNQRTNQPPPDHSPQPARTHSLCQSCLWRRPRRVCRRIVHAWHAQKRATPARWCRRPHGPADRRRDRR